MRAGAALAVLAALALAGCSEYARVSMKNAPGVTDLSKPIERENGDPKRLEPATAPGTRTLTVFATPSFMIGAGRQPLPAREAAFEPGLELRFERYAAPPDARDGGLFPSRAFAITAGVGFAQVVKYRETIAGPLFAELNYRFPSWNKAPTDIGIGPVVYPSEVDVGGQLTVRLVMVAGRARYLVDGGFELWGGFQIPVPFFFQISR
jgi:hypothetical protein